MKISRYLMVGAEIGASSLSPGGSVRLPSGAPEFAVQAFLRP